MASSSHVRELHNEPEGSAILDEVVMWIGETVESR
jgi:hypothetical protein